MTPADHANTVRDAIEECAMHRSDRCVFPHEFVRVEEEKMARLAALDALQAQANVAAEQMRVADREIRHALERNVELRAERGAAEAERDFLLSDPDNVSIKEWHDRLKAEREAAEQRATDMEKALRQIANAEIDDRLDDLIHGSSLRKLARAALAATAGKDKT